jgi:hypothetical protein
MDSDYENLLAERNKTLVIIRFLLSHIRSLITVLQSEAELEIQKGREHKCNCCKKEEGV